MSRPAQLGQAGTVAIALWLTAIGGFVDAVGYIALFQVFTANMSGNSVRVGIYFGKSNLSDIVRPTCAIGFYVVGLVAARIALQIGARVKFRRVVSYTFAVEALLLMLFATATPAMHMGQIIDLNSAGYLTLVALLAAAMGIQAATLTHVGALTVYTTFVTGTLTKFSEAFTRMLFWIYDQLKASHRLAHITKMAARQEDVRDTVFLSCLWLSYVVGAAAGTISKHRWELRTLYFPVVILLVVIVIDQLRPIGVKEELAQKG